MSQGPAGTSPYTYVTNGGVSVWRTSDAVAADEVVADLATRLDDHRGVLFTSNYEFPGRYNRWSRGFVDPPLVIEGRGRSFSITALNERGEVLLAILHPVLDGVDELTGLTVTSTCITGNVIEAQDAFSEEERSKRPSIFTLVRAVRDLFAHDDEGILGLDGAFGYDLAFQFDDVETFLTRSESDRDLVLYIPDEIYVVDHASGSAARHRYEFAVGEATTEGMDRSGTAVPYAPASVVSNERDHQPGEYASAVEEAKQAFRRGDLFEVVLAQSFFRPSTNLPSEVFQRIRRSNPAPFGGLLNLGDGEYLISGSPEMYVRVTGSRVETCPIAGTIARGADVLADSQAMVELLNSEKATSELTMCTDVDRNDKSRVCVPGSVRVIGRRQVEFYSKLIHTVDHVEGRLKPGFDAIDAFLSHMWAVTVTGAPKLWSMRFIEQHERSPRRWYAGAIGSLSFNGDLNTGLTIRTVQVRDGIAEVRTGSTLLIDSEADEEERETEVKASAFLAAITAGAATTADSAPESTQALQSTHRVLLLDHEDSFVHTLAGYLRTAGAEVLTVRAPLSRERFTKVANDFQPDLVFLSPGPGRPEDFRVGETIDQAVEHGLPVFGVCLGLQGIVERFGGKLGVLDYPMHGKPSTVKTQGGVVFEGLPDTFRAGRYHSLYALIDDLPEDLVVTAQSDDGIVMAVEHRNLPIAAVQFHPESIMSAEGEVGMRLVRNVLDRLTKRD